MVCATGNSLLLIILNRVKILIKQVFSPLVLIVSLTAILTACTGNRYQTSGPIHDPYAVKPEPVRIKKYKAYSVLQEHQIMAQVKPKPLPQQPSSPAVLALLGDAENRSKAGRLDSAAATIERALRIEPRNATLVYKLAEIRMRQGKPRLAEDLAKKANILASGNPLLKKQIWTLMAHSRQKQGDQQGALEAATKASSY